MLADDHACTPKNPYPGEVYHNKNKLLNLYGDEIEVDYRGYEVTAENFIRVLTDRHDASVRHPLAPLVLFLVFYLHIYTL